MRNSAGSETLERDDDRLMEEIQGGNPAAFNELYDRFHDRSYRVAWAVCHNDGRAEDAVQEAFVSLWRSAATYNPMRGSVAGWLLSLVRNRAIDVARTDVRHASKRADEAMIELRSAPESTADDAGDREAAARLKALLGRLPEAQREVITLAFYGQLSHTEIATRLGLPTGTVKGRMRLGLQRLRVDIDERRVAAGWHLALMSAFRAGRLEPAQRVVREASAEMPVVRVLDDVLAPAMHEIGSLWKEEEISITEEQRATKICRRLLAEISGELVIAPANTRETVLLLAPAPERHTFGLQMASTVLGGAGYRAVLLGGRIGDEALGAALVRHRPEIVALTSTMPSTDSLAMAASQIRATIPSAELLIGGATAARLPPEIAAHQVPRLDGLLSTVAGLVRS